MLSIQQDPMVGGESGSWPGITEKGGIGVEYQMQKDGLDGLDGFGEPAGHQPLGHHEYEIFPHFQSSCISDGRVIVS